MGSEYTLRVTLMTFLLAVGKFPNTVSSGLMQWAIHTVETWCGETGLSVNPDKTELVVFRRKKKLNSLDLFLLQLLCTVISRSSISG